MIRVKYPLLFIGLFWLLGLIIGSFIQLPLYSLYIILLVGLIFLIGSFIRYFKKASLWLLLLFLSLFFFALIRMEFYQYNHQSFLSSETINNLNSEIGLRGYISSKPIINGDLVKFTVKPNTFLVDEVEYETQSNEEIIVYLYLHSIEEIDVVESWKSGIGIKLFGEIESPNTARNPGQFDYKKYLEHENIYWIIKVEGISKIEVSQGRTTATLLDNIREILLLKVDSLYDEPVAGFVKAITLGERNALAVDINDDFSILGLSHLLAISGLHLSILSLMLFWLLTKLGMTREKSALLISIIIFGYMFLTGASPSVVRATVMTVMLLFSFLYKNRLNGLQALSLAFLFITIIKPLWIYDIGFQLSFIITFYIIWGLPIISNILPIENRFLNKSISIILITQAASFPLIFYYFNQYSLLSIFANMLFVPIFSFFVLPFAIVTIILALLHLYIGNIFANLLTVIIEGFFDLFHKASQLNIFHFYGNFNSPYWVIIYYLFLSWLLLRGSFKSSFYSQLVKSRVFLLEKVFLLLIFFVILFSLLISNDGTVTFIDVGQGDSTLIETPEGYRILIDSGGNFKYAKEDWQRRRDEFEVGEDVILPFLHYKGIDTIDFAVLTHEDYDHMGGYFSLIDKVDIKMFVVPSSFPRTELGEELYKKIEYYNIPIYQMNSAKTLNIDQYTNINFIPIEVDESRNDNDHTLIAFLNMYDTAIAFPADLELNGETLTLEKYILTEVDILKVGHHGSNTSTSEIWLKTLQPKDAVISVGEQNRYGHPYQAILDRLGDYQIKIWRTDRDGAIVVYVKPASYGIDTIRRGNERNF